MRWLVGPMIVLLPHVGMAAQLSGFYKSFSVGFDSPQAGDPMTGMVSNRLRLNLACRLISATTLSCVFRIRRYLRIRRRSSASIRSIIVLPIWIRLSIPATMSPSVALACFKISTARM